MRLFLITLFGMLGGWVVTTVGKFQVMLVPLKVGLGAVSSTMGIRFVDSFLSLFLFDIKCFLADIDLRNDIKTPTSSSLQHSQSNEHGHFQSCSSCQRSWLGKSRCNVHRVNLVRCSWETLMYHRCGVSSRRHFPD